MTDPRMKTAPTNAATAISEALARIKQAARYVAVGDGCYDPYASHVQAVDDAVDILAKLLPPALSSTDGLTTEEGWRDIASAPKDGTPFDAWVPDAFGGRRMTGLSFNRRGQLRQYGLLSPAELPRWPTHWRPLPSSPAEVG